MIFEWFKSTKFYRKGQFNLISTLTKNSTILDLYFMSLCNRHIIANSTFSWWGISGCQVQTRLFIQSIGLKMAEALLTLHAVAGLEFNKQIDCLS